MFFSEVRHQEERSKAYLGSPSLVRLPDGAIVASHDYFGPQIRNLEGESGLSSIYRSEDDGKTWVNVTHLIGAFWGTLFIHQDALYHISISQEYGDVLIRRSDDGGFTWTSPRDENSGRLFIAGKGGMNPNYHFGGATSVLVRGNRIYKALENFIKEPDGSGWWCPARFSASVISAPVDADLLSAENWTRSNELPFPRGSFSPDLKIDQYSGWLEGTLEEDPHAKLKMLMRVHLGEIHNKAAIIDVADDGRTISFNHENGLIDFIGGHVKFTVRRDPVTGKYFTITNDKNTGDVPTERNTLYLAVSDDLRQWRKLKLLLFDDTGLPPEYSCKLTGFQYPDWQFDGDNLIYLVRTAYRGAHNFHDSNRITYHVECNFRRLIDSKI